MQTIKTDAGNFFIWFGDQPGRGKITLGMGDYGHHYTILINQKHKVINIHKTIENKNGQKYYEQLFEMSFYTFLRYCVMIDKAETRLLHKYWFAKRINIGKLRRHDCFLFPLTSDENVAKQLIDQKRQKKILLKKEIPVEFFLNLHKYPEEIHDSEYSTFWVYSMRRGKFKDEGFIFRHPQDRGSRSFFYVTKRNFEKYKRDIAITLFNILQNLNFKHKKEVLEYMFAHLTEKYPAA